MLLGLNEKLELVLSSYLNEDTDTDWADVMELITDSVAAGDLWQVPVDSLPDGMNETDFPEGHILERLPTCVKKTLGSKQNEPMFCAFTSPRKLSSGDSAIGGGQRQLMRLPAVARRRQRQDAKHYSTVLLT